MKKLFAIALMLFVMAGVQAQTIKFDTLQINYGSIDKGANGQREFKFTNTGNAPLIISNAQGSCGCTVPQWPKDPIMPGQSNVIKVQYDTQRVGPFTKYVTLTTNDAANNSLRLTITGEIKAPPVQDATNPPTKNE